MKVWEKIIEVRLRERVEINKQHYVFMPGKETNDVVFALRMLMKKYREGQKELHYVFMDLQKAYDRVPTEELGYSIRKIRNDRKLCANCTGYVQGKQNSAEVCGRNYRKVQGQGQIAPGINVKSFLVYCDYG